MWAVFPFVCIFFNFFHQCLQFSAYKSPSLVRLLHPWAFYSLWSYCKWDCFLNSLLDCLLLLSRNKTDFCILILYSVSLLNSLISSNIFFCGIFRVFLHTRACKLWTDNFTSFFPIWMHYISFVCLIALVRTSYTVLHRKWTSLPCSWS